MTPIGLYTSGSRLRTDGAGEALAELDALGYDGLWVANVQDDLPVLDLALEATSRMTVGSAVVSVWSVPASELAAWWAGRDRLRLGIGVSHAPMVEGYGKPLATLGAYLDKLDDAAVPPQARLVGANGPKMLAMCAARSAGALTYLVVPEQTAVHRAALGPDARLIPEIKVVLDEDADRARSTARAHLATYLTLPNYLSNLHRMGFTEEDVRGPGSDRLVDALVAHGDEGAVLERVRRHVEAGADGVALHVLGSDPLPLPAWRTLAGALELSGARA